MDRYTVVISDVGKHDKGYRRNRAYWWLANRFGAYAELGLYWFLVEYFGRRSVTLMRPSELIRQSQPLETDWLFVGLPTSFGRQHLEKIKFRRMVLYDSTDYDGVNFGDSDARLLLSESNLCLKNFRDRRWSLPVHIGFLPIKRPPLNNRLSIALARQAKKNRSGDHPVKQFDVGFVARPTGTIESNQRLRWMVELKRDRPDLTLWGGLIGGDPCRQSMRDHINAQAIESLWINKKKIGFFSYFDGLLSSKVALAPKGYAPWTYRHFEAMYAGCVVVSNDLTPFEFLIPFPRDRMVEVSDDASVVPAIEKALAMREERPEIVDENIAYLDRWLDAGKYSRKRHAPLNRFMSELEAA